jgi:hypothetical protein
VREAKAKLKDCHAKEEEEKEGLLLVIQHSTTV